jgi:hypothetical protein
VGLGFMASTTYSGPTEAPCNSEQPIKPDCSIHGRACLSVAYLSGPPDDIGKKARCSQVVRAKATLWYHGPYTVAGKYRSDPSRRYFWGAIYSRLSVAAPIDRPRISRLSLMRIRDMIRVSVQVIRNWGRGAS